MFLSSGEKRHHAYHEPYTGQSEKTIVKRDCLGHMGLFWTPDITHGVLTAEWLA